MAGSGITVDVCKDEGRRVIGEARLPIRDSGTTEQEGSISTCAVSNTCLLCASLMATRCRKSKLGLSNGPITKEVRPRGKNE